MPEMPDLEASISTAPELSPDRLAALTSRFVSIKSVNGVDSERDLAVEIAGELEAYGFESALVGDPDRPSLGARAGGEPLVVLNGHLDTVPVDDRDEWRFDPFSGQIEGGAVHGRGACDMKGGLAIQVAVAHWLASLGAAHGLVLHFAMGEERGEPGTEDLLDAGFVAPMGIVLEPTDLQLGIAQRGLVTLRITITGRAGHASQPALARNPISVLRSVLSAIDHLDTQPAKSHPLLGRPQWTPTMIHSGVIPSMVPGSCVVHVDRRMIPGETIDGVVATLSSELAQVDTSADIQVEVAEEEGIYEPAEVDADCDTVAHMRQALESQGQEVRIFGTPYSSDVRHLINSAGIEAVTFGPGRASELHARDEHIMIEELADAARVVAAFALRAMGEGGGRPEHRV
jgi:succinyl-diaminopimelate desuccinylase